MKNLVLSVLILITVLTGCIKTHELRDVKIDSKGDCVITVITNADNILTLHSDASLIGGGPICQAIEGMEVGSKVDIEFTPSLNIVEIKLSELSESKEE